MRLQNFTRCKSEQNPLFIVQTRRFDKLKSDKSHAALNKSTILPIRNKLQWEIYIFEDSLGIEFVIKDDLHFNGI